MAQIFNMDEHSKEFWKKKPEVLSMLLADRTRSVENDNVYMMKDTEGLHYIMWCTDGYKDKNGKDYAFTDEITPTLILDDNNIIIRRSQKSREEQTTRSKDKAEVFTPSWICNAQNNLVDNAWFGKDNVFNTEHQERIGTEELPWDTNCEVIEFPNTNGKTWKDYVQANRMEMACGEAPYITSRYDAVSNKFISVEDRIGLLDRKLRVVCENAKDSDWLLWSYRALYSIYGFEWQGDNLFIARKEILFTWIEHYYNRFHSLPDYKSIRKVATIISWNIWQMDGMKYCIPESKPLKPCRIRNWRQYENEKKTKMGNRYSSEYFYESIK